jgi:hypothetical protein
MFDEGIPYLIVDDIRHYYSISFDASISVFDGG